MEVLKVSCASDPPGGLVKPTALLALLQSSDVMGLGWGRESAFLTTST